MDHDSMAQSPAPRPLCGCKKQRTDRGSRLGGALLGLYSRAGFSAAEIRFRVRQRRELGIERFRRVGLCTEESDAATMPPGDVIPRTDADAAVGVTSAVGKPIPLRPVSGPSGTRCGRRRGSRPLCGCKKQRTDRGSRLGGALLGLYSRAGFSAAEIRFRVRQRRELGIERFRRVGLCTEESDAATMPPGDVIPRTDADAAVGVTSAVGKPIPLRPVSGPSGTRCGRRRGSRPLCGCKKQRTDRGSRLSAARLGLYSRAGFSAAEIRFRVRQRRELGIERFRRVGLCTEESDAATMPPLHYPLCTPQQQAVPSVSLWKQEGPQPAIHYPLSTPQQQALPAVSLRKQEGPQPAIHYPLSTPQQQALPAVSLWKQEGPLPAVQHSRWNPFSFTGGDAVSLRKQEGPQPAIHYPLSTPQQQALPAVSLWKQEGPQPAIHYPLSTPQQQALPAVSLWKQEGPQPAIHYPLSTPQQQALPAVSLWKQEGPQPAIHYPLSTPQQQALPAVSLWKQEGPQPAIHYPLSTPQQQAVPAVSLWKQEGPQPAVQHSRWSPFSFTGGDAVRISTGRPIKY
nr:unnamed protein product [Leishmania braziliensis]